MPYHFQSTQARPIEPTGGPGAILETLEHCAVPIGSLGDAEALDVDLKNALTEMIVELSGTTGT